MRYLRIITIILLLSPAAFAQDENEPRDQRRVSDLPQVSGDIKVDGNLDDVLWQQALHIALDYETRPGENISPPVKTDAYLMQNGSQLLVAFRAHDPEPDAIRAYLRDRDSAYNDDFVGIVLDTFNDERRAFEFFANPLGAQMDLIQDDVNGREDDSWDAIWSSAGRITDQGYTVEMAIPLSQLRFSRSEQDQLWGIDTIRFYPRTDRHRLSNNPLDRGVNCYLCQLEKIRGFSGIEPVRDLEIVPTLTGIRADSTDDPGVTPLVSGDIETELGLTARWGITPDLTLNLALNPDFSQVEADVAQLDVNNQFALFFPEKRPFFLEGADFFNSPIRAVFTRTIADPKVGLKLTGKHDKHTFGVFAADDEITNLLFPGAFGSDATTLDQSSQSLVGRYRRDFGDSSTVGAMFTGRSGDGYHNYVGGVDGRFRFKGTESIRFQYLRSDTQYPDSIVNDFDQPAGSFDGSALQVQYNHDSRNWFWYLSHRDFDPDFRADLGFVRRVNYDQQVAGLGRVWHGAEDDWWNRFRISGDWDITHDNLGRVIERELEGSVNLEGPMQSFIELGRMERQRLFNDVLFDEERWSFYGEFQPRGGLFFGLSASTGDSIDFANTQLGEETRWESDVRWNINKHLLMRWRNTTVKLDSLQGPNIFEAKLNDLRLTWQFNVRSFLRLVLQSQDVDRNQDQHVDTVDSKSRSLGSQLLYSYKVNPQTVLFVGYSDNQIENDDIARFTTTGRTLFIKLGYAWFPN